MGKFIPYLICAFLIILGIKGSIESSVYERSIKYSLNRMVYYLSIFIAFVSVSTNLNKIFGFILDLSSQWFNFNGRENEIFRILTLIIIYFLIQTSIYFILKFILNIFFVEKDTNNNFRIIFLSGIFGALKGLIAIVIMFIGIITYNTTIGTDLPIRLFDNINTYSNLKKVIANKKPDLEYLSSEKFIPANNVLIYYNGVTLEDGIKSNDTIDNKAIELTTYSKTDREKAKRLYVWIGSNIKYDYNKAEKALNNENTGESGAIIAWNTRQGICFDYSCLYVAMSRAIGLKVRLVTGSGFDGKQYGPHAWNEVYLEDEGKWIPVDTTFYLAGDYFDCNNFYQDHIKEGIAGEW